ncbi:hypothetical protein [Geomonas ferrireducens]|uniref:hypothetical protein n=1 Tax=Geomonas ferrireducens TaxID=2570227 RepID=UPI0010A7DE6A|nr:hypothetical protein [Geomonas ferrireducens]
MRAFYLLAVLFGLVLGGCGVEWLPPPPQVEQFSFTPSSVDGVATGSTQTSNAVTLTMDTSNANISVSGGEYSVNGGAFTSTAGTVVNGDTVQVRQTAASTAGTTVTTTLTVGDKRATFSSTTAGGADAFSFSPTAVFNVTPGSTQTSNAATVKVSGTAPISVTGGEYSVDGSAFTSSSGSIGAGTHTVQVQQTAASGATTTATTTVTIGGTSASFISSTTNVADQTVNATGAADTTVTTPVTLHLVSGTHSIQVVEGAGAYSLNGAEGDFSVDEQTVTLTDGQVIYVQDFALPGTGSVATTLVAIDGGIITYEVTTQ